MIGIDGAARNSHAQLAALGAEAVLAVVDQRQPGTVVLVIQRRPLLSGLLHAIAELFDIAKGHGQQQAGVFGLHREGQLDDGMLVLQMNAAAHLQLRAASGQQKLLRQRGSTVVRRHPDARAHRPFFYELHHSLVKAAHFLVKGEDTVRPGIGGAVIYHHRPSHGR